MSDNAPKSAAASLFDLRTVIAVLFAFYGIVLTIMGFFDGQDELKKAGGIAINLWTGIGMLILAAFFIAWARAKPMGVDPADDGADRPPMHH